MALTYTPEAEMGSKTPEFSLTSVDGKPFKNTDFDQYDIKVFAFICNHCPYVKAIEDRLIQLNVDLGKLNSTVIGICSNDPSEYPEDSKENLFKRSVEKNYAFPYLYDEDQIVAKKFGAVCTPDFFVYNQENKLIYRGRLDDSWKNADNVREQELKNAVESWLKSQTIVQDQTPSMGCSIKWK